MERILTKASGDAGSSICSPSYLDGIRLPQALFYYLQNEAADTWSLLPQIFSELHAQNVKAYFNKQLVAPYDNVVGLSSLISKSLKSIKNISSAENRILRSRSWEAALGSSLS